VGLSLSGDARAVLDICRRRVRVYFLPENDFYQRAFVHGLAAGGRSWAALSGAVLRAFGILDWPAWDTGAADQRGYIAHGRQ